MKKNKIQEKTMERNFGSGDFELKTPPRGRDGDLTGKAESTKDSKNGFYVINSAREKSRHQTQSNNHIIFILIILN